MKLENSLRWRQEVCPETVQWADIRFMAGQPVCATVLAALLCVPVCLPTSISCVHTHHRTRQKHIRAATPLAALAERPAGCRNWKDGDPPEAPDRPA